MPDNDDEERDTFTRNIRLTATWPVFFAFLVNPILAITLFWYLIIHRQDIIFYSSRIQVTIPILYLIFSSTFVPLAVKAYEEERLRRRGYEQRWLLSAQIDWLLNLGVGVGCTHWMSKQDTDGELVGWYVVLITSVSVLSTWLIAVLGFLGPMWWFTKRLRSAQLV